MGMSVNSDSLLSDINVTPFVDVMLVLLIIFMVTAPMLTQGVDVDLPQTKAVSALPEDSEVLVLTVKADGSLWLDQYQVTVDELPDHLQRLVMEQKKHLFLKADRSVPYGRVVEVMGEIKAAGIERLGVVADPISDKNGKGK